MARTPNQWNFASTRILNQLIGDFGQDELALRLGVSYTTVRNWTKGSIPSDRFQIAMANLTQPVKKTNIGSVPARIANYLKATKVTREDFATLVGKSETTVTNWINRKSNPRSLKNLNLVLQNPRPFSE
tara:strand:- start:94072 stop:94458 length:387 start_codon:yes stop_codon:yes gene_type:complete